MRRVATFVAAVAVALLATAVPAHAAGGISGVLAAQDSGASGVVQGDMHWNGGTNPTIDTVKISVTPAGGQPASPVDMTWCSQCGSASVGISWRTPALAYNGPYFVTVNANGTQHPGVLQQCDGSCAQTGTATQTFRIAVAPATPRRLATKVDAAAHAVTVTWDRNAEPDTVGYVLQRRAPGDADYQALDQVAQPTAPTVTYTDTRASSGGAYAYQVVAVRRGADETQFVTSAPATTSALVEAPTSAGAPGGGATGDGSGGASDSPQQVGAPGRPPTHLRSGTVDAAKFSVLQSQVKLPSNQRVTTPTTMEPDAGFDEALPFAKRATTATSTGADGANFPAVVHAPTSNNRKALVVSMAFAGIVFCVAFHLRLLMRRIDTASATPSVSPWV